MYPTVDHHPPAGTWSCTRRSITIHPPVHGHVPDGRSPSTRRYMVMYPPVDHHPPAGTWSCTRRSITIHPPVHGHVPADRSPSTRRQMVMYRPVDHHRPAGSATPTPTQKPTRTRTRARGHQGNALRRLNHQPPKVCSIILGERRELAAHASTLRRLRRRNTRSLERRSRPSIHDRHGTKLSMPPNRRRSDRILAAWTQLIYAIRARPRAYS
jgi:hypothetical protein